MGQVLHVQNVFDALEPSGVGVAGDRKTKCVIRLNRSVAFAENEDFVAIDSTCPIEYLDYVIALNRIESVRPVLYRVAPSPRALLEDHEFMRGLSRDPAWRDVLEEDALLLPYMASSGIYEGAAEAGMHVDPSVWEVAVEQRLVDLMNDKGVLHRECVAKGFPVPESWVVARHDLVERSTELLAETPALYVRETRSSGGLGNVTLRRTGPRTYCVPEMGCEELSKARFEEVVRRFSNEGGSEEFVVSEWLDLAVSPGSLFYCDDEKTSFCAHDEQVLDDYGGFLGFVTPMSDTQALLYASDVERIGRELMEPWRQRGFRGYTNLDWMVTRSGDMYVAERNARQTSVVLPLTLARKAGREVRDQVERGALAVSARDTVQMKRRADFAEVLTALRERDLDWRHEKVEGVLVSIPPTASTGLQLLGLAALAEKPERAEELLVEAADLLCCGWEGLGYPR